MEEGGVTGSIPTPCKVKPGILVERGRGRAHYLPRLEGYDSSKGRVTCRFLSYKKDLGDTFENCRSIDDRVGIP